MNDRHPALAWMLGWLVPGAGHWYLGQRARGAVLGAALIGCFVAGVLIGGRSTVSAGKPEYLVLQWGAGLPAAAAWAAGDASPADVPVSRRELGILYTLVPALLNIVAALDAAARAAGADPGAPHPSEGKRPEDGGPEGGGPVDGGLVDGGLVGGGEAAP